MQKSILIVACVISTAYALSLPVDVCKSTPEAPVCGEGAVCEKKVREGKDVALCSCPLGYTGDPFTKCQKSDCKDNADCSSDEICLKSSCRKLCSPSPCGENATCSVQKSQPICACPSGFTGDPFTKCTQLAKVID